MFSPHAASNLVAFETRTAKAAAPTLRDEVRALVLAGFGAKRVRVIGEPKDRQGADADGVPLDDDQIL